MREERHGGKSWRKASGDSGGTGGARSGREGGACGRGTGAFAAQATHQLGRLAHARPRTRPAEAARRI